VLADFEPVRVDVQATGQDGVVLPRHGTLYTFAVCNSRLIGGGRIIAPHAVIDDGWLDVCFIHAMPTLEFVALLRRVSAGDHVDDERVSYFRTRELELVFERQLNINTDGQVLEADRCRYDVLPGAVRVLLPA
jgi:diacylglycerol kinase family enzyme